MAAFAFRVIISVGLYFLLKALIDALIKEPRANEVFTWIVLVAAVLFAIFGYLFKFSV